MFATSSFKNIDGPLNYYRQRLYFDKPYLEKHYFKYSGE